MDFLSFFRGRHTVGGLHIPEGWIARKDKTGGSPYDVDKLVKAFTGEDPEIALYSSMLLQPVEVPVDMTGIPQLQSGDSQTQEALNVFKAQYLDTYGPQTVRTMLLTGTAWRWPRYTEKCGVFVENIPDTEVQDVTVNRETGEPQKIWMDSQIEKQAYKSFWRQEQVERLRRAVDREQMTIQDNRGIKTVNNFLGTIPIPFAHDKLEGRVRGTPVYGRIYSSAKIGHRILKQAAEIASKFNPKLIQTLKYSGSDTADKWLANQKDVKGREKVDPLKDEIYININHGTEGSDTTQFSFLPSDALGVHEKLLALIDHHIIVGSGLPELFWSQLSRSNYASAEIAAELGVKYIKSIQSEMGAYYQKLIDGWLKIYGYVHVERYRPYTLSWSSFDLLGVQGRANVFSTYAGAIGQLMASGALTKDLAYYFLKLFFSDAPQNHADGYIDEILAFTETRKQMATESDDLGEWPKL